VTVFVLTSGFDYEGESPVGVYASMELAKQAAEQKSQWIECEFGVEWNDKDGESEFRFGSSYYTVREEVVIRPGSLAGMATETFIH
jgi:hypothetical protein